MDGGTIDIKLRPIKIAFLVEPTDKKAILESIKVNSFLWGGVYNPIIPVFKKIPSLWKRDHSVWGFSAKKILQGYLEAYNPDYVALVGRCANKNLDLGNYKKISINDIFSEIDDDGTPKYGVGLFEILSDFYKKELKFQRRQSINFYHLSSSNSKLFFAGVFGQLPKKINNIFIEHWSENLDTKKEKVDFSNYTNYLVAGKLFLRRMLYHEIEPTRNRSCLFYMDAENAHDVIDYWNLRALGWSILPIAKQSATFEQTKKAAEFFIDSNSGPHRYNQQIYISATIMKGRSIDQKDVTNFIGSLNIKKDEKANGPRVSVQHWYPRIWDEWARDKDSAVCSEIEADTDTVDFSAQQKYVSAKTLDPEFASRFGGHGTPRFANVVNIRSYYNEEIFAEVIPDAGKEATRVLSGMGMTEWRFTKKESVFLAQHTKWRMHVNIPNAEELFQAWLKDSGLSSKLSSAGMIAKQMVKRLGGLWGLEKIANEEFIKLLREMESGKEIKQKPFLDRITKISSKFRYGFEPSEFLKSCIEKNIFRMGATLQCPICSHRTWYPINKLDYKLQCVNCLDTFNVPTHTPGEIEWSYRTFGPFSLSGAAEGAYSTLLVLRMFSRILDFPITPIMSFLTNIAGKEREIDLGMLFREKRMWKDDDVKAAFVEAKTFSHFEKKDIQKMSYLAKKFPGSVLVFATMNETLSNKEKSLLKPLINRCRKYWKAEQPYNPVLILTKTELFAQLSLDYTWKEAGDKYKKFGERSFYSDKLLHICDATQQLYLGMKPWHDEIREKFETKMIVKKKKLPSQTNI